MSNSLTSRLAPDRPRPMPEPDVQPSVIASCEIGDARSLVDEVRAGGRGARRRSASPSARRRRRRRSPCCGPARWRRSPSWSGRRGRSRAPGSGAARAWRASTMSCSVRSGRTSFVGVVNRHPGFLDARRGAAACRARRRAPCRTPARLRPSSTSVMATAGRMPTTTVRASRMRDMRDRLAIMRPMNESTISSAEMSISTPLAPVRCDPPPSGRPAASSPADRACRPGW